MDDAGVGLSEPGFSGLQDFQDWSLEVLESVSEDDEILGDGAEWHKLESLCYEEGCNVRGAMNCATTNAFSP